MRFFPAYTFTGHIRSVPHERKKIGFGSVEPCSVNEARVTSVTTLSITALCFNYQQGANYSFTAYPSGVCLTILFNNV